MTIPDDAIVASISSQNIARMEFENIVGTFSPIQRVSCAFDIIVNNDENRNKTRACFSIWNPNAFGSFLCGVRTMLNGGYKVKQQDNGISVQIVATQRRDFATLVPVLAAFFGNSLVFPEHEETRIRTILDAFFPEDETSPSNQKEKDAIANQEFSSAIFYSFEQIAQKRNVLELE